MTDPKETLRGYEPLYSKLAGNPQAKTERAEAARLRAELAEHEARERLFHNCLRRAEAIHRQRNPDYPENRVPDGALSFAAVLDEVAELRGLLNRVVEINDDVGLGMFGLCDETRCEGDETYPTQSPELMALLTDIRRTLTPDSAKEAQE